MACQLLTVMQVVELSSEGRRFLQKIFNEFDGNGDEHLSKAEQEEMFSASPTRCVAGEPSHLRQISYNQPRSSQVYLKFIGLRRGWRPTRVTLSVSLDLSAVPCWAACASSSRSPQNPEGADSQHTMMHRLTPVAMHT